MHTGLEEPEERDPNYYGDDTEPKRGSIPLDEAFTRPDRFVLHHIAAREKKFEPMVASYANKARNPDQVSKEQGDQSRTLDAAIPGDRHGQREMAKRATLVDWAHAYADKCTVHGPRQVQYVHFGKEATDRTEADEWTKVMETIVPPEYPQEIRDQIDSKYVSRKGEGRSSLGLPCLERVEGLLRVRVKILTVGVMTYPSTETSPRSRVSAEINRCSQGWFRRLTARSRSMACDGGIRCVRRANLVNIHVVVLFLDTGKRGSILLFGALRLLQLLSLLLGRLGSLAGSLGRRKRWKAALILSRRSQHGLGQRPPPSGSLRRIRRFGDR